MATQDPPILNERLDEGEIFLLMVKNEFLGYRIRGKAQVNTVHGKVDGESKILFSTPPNTGR